MKKLAKILLLIVFFAAMQNCTRQTSQQEVRNLIRDLFNYLSNGQPEKAIALFSRQSGGEPNMELSSLQSARQELKYSINAIELLTPEKAAAEVVLHLPQGEQTLLITALLEEGQWMLDPQIRIKTIIENIIPLRQ